MSFIKVVSKAHKDGRFESFITTVILEHYETVLDHICGPLNAL